MNDRNEGHESPPTFEEAMLLYSEISLIPAPTVFSSTDPNEGDEVLYGLLTDGYEGVASYADMIRDHEIFTVDSAMPEDIVYFPNTTHSRVMDKALYQSAVEDGFMVHESIRRVEGERLVYAGEGGRGPAASISVAAAGSDGALTFDEARETYARFTICAPDNGSVRKVTFDGHTRHARAKFSRIAAMPGSRLLRAVPRRHQGSQRPSPQSQMI